jgi:hypothetical protein
MDNRLGTRGAAMLTVALMAGNAGLTAYAANPIGVGQTEPKEIPSFKDLDTDKNGFLLLEEFEAKGMDNLTLKAADIDGDGSVKPDEYARYLKALAADQAQTGTSKHSPTGSAPEPKPADAPVRF